MTDCEKAFERIESHLKILDKENTWIGVQREETIDLLVYGEIQNAVEVFGGNRIALGEFVAALIDEVEERLK